MADLVANAVQAKLAEISGRLITHEHEATGAGRARLAFVRQQLEGMTMEDVRQEIVDAAIAALVTNTANIHVADDVVRLLNGFGLSEEEASRVFAAAEEILEAEIVIGLRTVTPAGSA